MDGDEDSVVLVCGADEAYAMHMAAMLTSVVENFSSKRELNIYILDNGISGRKKRAIKDVCKGKYRWLETNSSQLDELKVTGHISGSTYLRLLIPYELPESVDKALYLDVDLIVECDITELWETDIKDHALGAVQDMSIPYVSDPRGLSLYKKRGLDANQPYFNAGVLLINVEEWRKQEIPKRVFEYLRQYEDNVRYHDQDGLNFVLANDWKPLDRRWNVHSKVKKYETWEDTSFKASLRSEIDALRQSPRIIHYIGKDKPWMYGIEVPWQERYFHYLRKSGWFDSEWDWRRWRLREASSYYSRCLSATCRQVLNETRRHLVPVARFLGIARSSRD